MAALPASDNVNGGPETHRPDTDRKVTEMSKRIGIDQNSVQKIVSGVRVAFDPRTTSEVEGTRDPANRKPRSPKKSTP